MSQPLNDDELAIVRGQYELLPDHLNGPRLLATLDAARAKFTTLATPKPGTWDSSRAIPVTPVTASCEGCGEKIHCTISGGNPQWYHENGFKDCRHGR